MQQVSKIYYSASEVAEMLDISKASAYNLIKKLNTELEKAGYIVIQGKISRAYFAEKWYGLTGQYGELEGAI